VREERGEQSVPSAEQDRDLVFGIDGVGLVMNGEDTRAGCGEVDAAVAVEIADDEREVVIVDKKVTAAAEGAVAVTQKDAETGLIDEGDVGIAVAVEVGGDQPRAGICQGLKLTGEREVPLALVEQDLDAAGEVDFGDGVVRSGDDCDIESSVVIEIGFGDGIVRADNLGEGGAEVEEAGRGEKKARFQWDEGGDAAVHRVSFWTGVSTERTRRTKFR
jgi:hypothetical protein